MGHRRIDRRCAPSTKVRCLCVHRDLHGGRALVAAPHEEDSRCSWHSMRAMCACVFKYLSKPMWAQVMQTQLFAIRSEEGFLTRGIQARRRCRFSGKQLGDDVLGPQVASLQHRGNWAEAPQVAVGSDFVGHRFSRMPSLHKGECGKRFTHVTRSDDMVPVAETMEHRHVMVIELATPLEKHTHDCVNIHRRRIHADAD